MQGTCAFSEAKEENDGERGESVEHRQEVSKAVIQRLPRYYRNICELKAEGRYSGTLYTIRYFQFEGQGSLKMDNGITFLPNDRYLLENEKFRLYYTSEGEDRHDFIVVIEDNLGNSHELTFDFNNSDGGSGDTERIEDTEGGGK